jgi:hypothetical protein
MIGCLQAARREMIIFKAGAASTVSVIASPGVGHHKMNDPKERFDILLAYLQSQGSGVGESRKGAAV